MMKVSHTVRRGLTWAVVGILIPLAGIAQSSRPSITVARVSNTPVIDGIIGSQEWTSAPYAVTFQLPRGTVRGSLWTMWDASKIYVAVEVGDASASEIDVILDEDGDGTLTQGDPAYLFWANGRAQSFHYEVARRAFIQNAWNSGRDFARASRVRGAARVYEFAIPYDASNVNALNRAPGTGPMGFALKYERTGAAGQFDTWPTTGVRDAITKSPDQWALLSFVPAPPPTVIDTTPPRVDFTVWPDRPTPSQTVSWRATAYDGYGLDRIELRADGSLLRTCTAATTCEASTGPYNAGTVVRAEAVAYDRHGNQSATSWTIAVQSPPVPTDTTPPAVPANIQLINPWSGNTLYVFWTNPTDADFGKIFLYRSTTAGTLGTRIAIPASSPYIDAGLNEGTTYYYTIRAVDQVGNETTNTSQYSGTPRRP